MASYAEEDGGSMDSDQEVLEEERAMLDRQNDAVPPAVLLATAGYDHTIRFWDVVTGVCTSTLQYNISQVNCLAITTDKRILGAAGNPQVHIFDTTSAAGPIRVLDGGQSGSGGSAALEGNVTALGFHASDPWLYTCSDDGSLRIWDLRAARCQRDIGNKAGITAAGLHPSQAEIVTADQGGSVKVWDLRSTVCSAEMIPEEGVPLRSVTINASGSLLAAANNNGRVYVWKEEEGLEGGYVPTSKIQAHSTYVTKCAFSPSGEYLATASADHTVGLWQFAATRSAHDGEREDSPNEHWTRLDDDDEGELGGEDGAALAETESSSDQGEHRLVMRHALEGHLKWVWDCAFSADSAYLVSASSDNTARLWSVSSGECIVIYTGHLKAVTTVALNDLAV